jgi:archaellum component FlaG (FlaF/FlaG flagellin family)
MENLYIVLFALSFAGALAAGAVGIWAGLKDSRKPAGDKLDEKFERQ